MSSSSFGRTYRQLCNWFRRPASRRKPRTRRLHLPPALEALESRLVPTGTWTRVAAAAPGGTGVGTMTLLSNGTVMAQGGGTVNTMYKLTPDASGSYINGTWSTLAPMHNTRLYYGSNVLPDGRVYAGGGEYSDGGSETNKAEIYDPVANTWTSIPNYPETQLGDSPSEILPDGSVLHAFNGANRAYIYNPSTNRWTATGSKLENDHSSEETFVLLPDHSVLTYNICFSSGTSCHVGDAQRFVPSSGTWVATNPAPNNLSNPGVGYEMGPALRVPDGRIIQFGATGHTAYYTPSTNSWVAGPDIPTDSSNRAQGADDTPAAMMPNGHILLAVDRPLFNGPTKIYEFDPTANTYTDVTPPGSIINTSGVAYTSRMLMLPSGQVLLTTGGGQLAVWTPTGNPDASWKPTVSSVANNGDGSYTLTGTQLNGISEGASYGDDAEMSSNYPIVQLRDSGGHVYYARTFNWSNTGVATGSTPVTTKFTPPANLPGGTYTLTVIANGIASANFNFTYAGVTHYGVTASTATPTAGTAFMVTVKALDANNNVVPGYRGTVHFTSSDAQGSLPANYTFTAADNGVHTFNVTLRTADSQTVTATDTAAGSINGRVTVTVNAALASQFYVLTPQVPSVAGSAFDITVYALDPYGNIDTNYQGTVTFSSADPYGATLPADYTFQAGDGGVAFFAGATALYTAGVWDVTATDVVSGIAGAGYVTVQAAPASWFYVAAPASASSGAAFDVTVYALDSYGNIDTNYGGTVTWTTTDGDPNVALPADYTFQPSDQGVVTYPGGVTLITQGDQTITATDTGSGITGSAVVTVTIPGPLPGAVMRASRRWPLRLGRSAKGRRPSCPPTLPVRWGALPTRRIEASIASSLPLAGMPDRCGRGRRHSRPPGWRWRPITEPRTGSCSPGSCRWTRFSVRRARGDLSTTAARAARAADTFRACLRTDGQGLWPTAHRRPLGGRVLPQSAIESLPVAEFMLY
jgi:hypothetical protein